MKKLAYLLAFVLIAGCTAAGAQTETTEPPATTTTTEALTIEQRLTLAESDIQTLNNELYAARAQLVRATENVQAVGQRIEAWQEQWTSHSHNVSHLHDDAGLPLDLALADHTHDLPDPGHCTISAPTVHYGPKVTPETGNPYLEKYWAEDITCEHWPTLHVEHHTLTSVHSSYRQQELVCATDGYAVFRWFEANTLDFCIPRTSVSTPSHAFVLDADGWAAYDIDRHGDPYAE